jgi:hypothetical protein
MIADYKDTEQGTSAALSIKKLFQDGVSIGGDDVCRAIVEDLIFDQILQQVSRATDRNRLVQLFREGVSEYGAAWRTLRAKLVPYFWLPLARCFWALGEGFTIPDHHSEKQYTVAEIFEIFQDTDWSPKLQEADRFVTDLVPGFPGFNNLFFKLDSTEINDSIDRVLREPLRRYADIIAQFDVDLLILAGRTSALQRVRELFVSEMPVPPPRIKSMSNYRVGDWYPASWRRDGFIKDPKSTVCAGAAVLHMATHNRLAGLLLEEVQEVEQKPIFGLYQESELFRDGLKSEAFPYSGGMMIGFRNVDSEEMDGSPLFEVLPANQEVEEALLEDRVNLRFSIDDAQHLEIAEVLSQRGSFAFEPSAFKLWLKTATFEKYWLDTGHFEPSAQYTWTEGEDGDGDRR